MNAAEVCERDYPIPEYDPSLSDDERKRISEEADAELDRLWTEAQKKYKTDVYRP